MAGGLLDWHSGTWRGSRWEVSQGRSPVLDKGQRGHARLESQAHAGVTRC